MTASTTSRWVLVAAIAAGVGLRLWEALESSLWLDELHSLVHAWKPADVAGVLEHVHWDFHAPLFFVGLHFVRTSTPELARIIPIVSSLLVLAPLLAFARRSRLGASAPALAAVLFALLPFQIQCATELRPYAWLTLASATACWAAFIGSARPRLRFAAFALAVAFGLLTHYLMAFVVLMIGAIRLLCALPAIKRVDAGSPRPLGLPWLVLAGALGACAFLPWLFNYMPWVIEQPSDLVPANVADRTVTDANRNDIAQAPLKSLVPQIRSLGAPWTQLAGAGAAMLAAGLIAGLVAALRRMFKRELPRGDPAIGMAVLFAAVTLTLVTAMSVWSWARVSIRYLWIAAWLWPLFACQLLGAIRGPRLRATAMVLVVAGAGIAGIAHAGGKTHEDVRGAVAEARRIGDEFARRDPSRPPIYSAVLWQPPRFEHCTPYLAYAPDLACVEPKDLPEKGAPGFDRPVVLITRRSPDLDRSVARDRVSAERHPVDDTMTVWVFTPRTP